MKKFRHSLITSLIIGLLPAVAWTGPVDINSADAETLAAELDGVGMAKARAIVEYRTKNGPFASAEDLGKVKGIGARVLAENKGNIRVNSEPPAKATK
ncbi:MAG: ComEA family DNA-binding protein [Gammaproteobacteria bacterium]